MTAPASSKEGPNSAARPSFLRSLVSGAGAGVVCTLVCAPLDVTKVRLQVQGTIGGASKYPVGIYASIRKIYVEEGLKGVFKGVGPALITVPLFWGVYWPLYDTLKTRFAEEDSGVSPAMGHVLSAVTAGAVGDVITNPFWVTRTRIQTLALHKESHLAADTSTVEMMKHIYRTEGWRAFYKGLSASFLGLTHVAIQFPLYEFLKKSARRGEDRRETFFELLFSSTAAKLVASAITYPHEVVRARLQDGRALPRHAPSSLAPAAPTGGSGAGHSLHRKSLHSTGTVLTKAAAPVTTATVGLSTMPSASAAASPTIVSILRDIVQREGVGALWSGIRVSMFRVVPSTASSFIAYEYISRYLKEQNLL